MKITFIESASGKRLSKFFSPMEKRSYPSVKQLNSFEYEHEATAKGLKTRFDLIREYAAKGFGMLKGNFTKQLVNESREGLTDKKGLTQTVIIDVDGLYMEHLVFPEKITPEHLKGYAELVVKMLPDYLHDVSYIAHASSSFGMRNGTLSLHLEFMLTYPMSASAVKNWIKMQNFECQEVSDKLQLSGSGMALSWVLDPCVADNSRIMYIAAPTFSEMESPFSDDNDRWVLVEKTAPSVDLVPRAALIKPAAIEDQRRKKIDGLRVAMKMPKFKPKTRLLMDSHLKKKVQVISNPDEIQMELVNVTDKYAYFNIQGADGQMGDSNAYWLKLASPDIIYNFKDEAPFEFAKACPELYDAFMSEHGGACIKQQTHIPMVVHDFHTDKHFAIEYDRPNDRIIQDESGRTRMASIGISNVDNFMLDRGQPPPDPIPTWDVVFDPTTTKCVDFGAKLINRFSAPEHIRNPEMLLPQYKNIGYKMGEENLDIAAILKLLCPNTYTLIWHIVGSDRTCFNHFINWLSWCVINRKVSSTAWVLSGVPGTGKDVFKDKVLMPLMGTSYVMPINLKTVEDQFNEHLETSLFVVVNEFRLGDSKNASADLDILKERIGSETGQVRGMRQNSRTAQFYCNWLFFSNHADVMPIEEGDRRMNIATPQRVKLKEAYPELVKNLNKLKAEVATFASYLLHFNPCEESARTCLENGAKSNMKVASLNTAQQFCYAAKTGDLDYFIENIMVDLTKKTDINEVTRIRAAQKIVQNWIQYSITGQDSLIEVDELLSTWQAMNPDATSNPSRFRNMLVKNDLAVAKRNVRGKPTSVIVTKWVAHTADIGEMTNNNLVSSDVKMLFEGVMTCNKTSVH